jgi:transglutaminase-like putative cysteine protease
VHHYLGADEIIDWDNPEVMALGNGLRRTHPTDEGFTKAAFEWVRDNVAHAYDAHDPRVTLSASDTLRERVGLCYAKSHLLVAVLRGQGIPAGLCYQRLADDRGGHVIHGLVAVFLCGTWHRQDPRGNKPGVNAQFSTSGEMLAWPVDPMKGECDDARVFVAPAPEVVTALRGADNMLFCPLPSDIK